MTYGSLFSGIGGFDLGFERAGFRGAWQVEIDPRCRCVLAEHFPAIPRFADIRGLDGRALGSVDLILAGFPCQGLSIAGRRRGLRDSRSGLFYEMCRIVSELSPGFLVWENVPGLFSSDKGRDFARVVAELARLGYFGAWRTFDAQYFGVAQRRRRVIGVFARGDFGASSGAEILSFAEGLQGYPAPRRAAEEKIAGTLTRSALDGSSPCGGDGRDGLLVAGTLCANGKASGSATQQDAESGLLVSAPVTAKWAKGTGGPAGDEWRNLVAATIAGGARAKQGYSTDDIPLIAFSCKDHGADAGALAPTLRAMGHAESHANAGGQVAIAGRSGVRRLTPLECERLQGFSDGWTKGFADGVRYRMIGNAVAVPKARWIARRMRQYFGT